MSKRFTRVGSLLLALFLIAQPFPAYAAEESNDLATTIEEQIRAFADSIDQSDVVDDAAKALAKHGMTKGGKKLSVGKSHALTALLFNTELLQDALLLGCTEAIRLMQTLNLTELPYNIGSCDWYGSTDSHHHLYGYLTDDNINENLDYRLYLVSDYSGAWNSYDDAADWIAAATKIQMSIERKKVQETDVTYSVTCTVFDRFDFATGSGSAFKDLISGIGALLFKEFNWESTVTFTLTVPNSCTHTSGNYHWTYDLESESLRSLISDGFTNNTATRQSTTDIHGNERYYFELDQPVRLYHGQPWVVEYEVTNPTYILFTPYRMDIGSSTAVCLRQQARTHLYLTGIDYLTLSDAQCEEYGAEKPDQWIRDYCGTRLGEYFKYDSSKTYTLRLENTPHLDGSNTIHLTVTDNKTGSIVLSRPMDDYFQAVSWSETMQNSNTESDWASGKDLLIRYIGNSSVPLIADQFELRVWENGKGTESESLCTETVTAPTCTKKGYTTYTCSACGYSYKGNYTKVTPHNYHGGICVDCDTDSVTATLDGDILTLSGELDTGTRILAVCYDEDERLCGIKQFVWNGEPISDTIPTAETIKIFFTDTNWIPLRSPLPL